MFWSMKGAAIEQTDLGPQVLAEGAAPHLVTDFTIDGRVVLVSKVDTRLGAATRAAADWRAITDYLAADGDALESENL